MKSQEIETARGRLDRISTGRLMDVAQALGLKLQLKIA